MPSVDFFAGKDLVLRVFVNGQEVVLNTKTFNVKANVTKANDGINGEDRDRLTRYINFFDISANCYQNDAKLLQALLDDIKNDDSQVAKLAKAAGIRIRVLDGSKAAFVVKELILDDFDFQSTGRTDKAMMNINMRCRYFDPVQAA